MKTKEIIIKTPKGIRKIGPGNPAFIIAEVSANHKLDYNRAIKIIDAAINAGVDAIKLQTYTPDTMTIDCDNKYFQVKVNDAWKGQTLYRLYKTAYTPWEWQPKLKKYAESKGVILFSTPFDASSVDFLEKMNVKLYKVASFEVGDIPLLKKIGKTKKPVIMSRGLSSEKDIGLALKTLKKAGCPSIAVLQCISSYPADPSQMNLRTIPYISKKFGVVSGISDHSLGKTIPITSMVLGASIIEKHFTLARSDGGPDAEFSLEPNELKELVDSVREAEKSLGEPTCSLSRGEKENKVFVRSIFVIKDIKAGEKFNEKNIRVIRPGYGMHPKYFEKILNKTCRKNVKRGTPLLKNMIK